MTDKEKCILSILNSALFFSELPPSVFDHWEDITKELNNHKVTSYAGAIPLLPKGSAKDTWRAAFAVQKNKFEKILLLETELYRVLSSAGIGFIILKGSAAAFYFPNPYARRQNDVDFLVERDKFDEAVSVLENHGFEKGEAGERHTSFKYKGIEFEMHRKFATLQSHDASEKLDEMLFDCIGKSELFECGDCFFPVPPPVENGLILLSHISQHLLEGIGLRQVLDWLMYLSRVCDESFWKSNMEKPVRELGLYDLAVNLTYMCQKYFELDTDCHTWCAEADDELCGRLMEYVFEQGDLGLKNFQEHSKNKIFMYASSPLKMLTALQKIGCKTWKTLEKHPWLRPFAWLYQIFRLLKKALTREKSTGSILKDMSDSSQKVKMLKKLGVRTYNKNVF